VKRNGRVDVTVITPTLPERGAMLAEAIASVAAQTVQPVAHLIGVDNAREGPGPILNQLVRAAETSWLSILADDDLYDPDHLETLLDAANGRDVVFSWSRITGSPERHEKQYRGDFDPVLLLNRRDSGMRGCFMFRRSAWKKAGGWPVRSPVEDWEFMRRLLLTGSQFRAVYRETWTYRFHDTNVSLSL
jgi:GT2 family glycosyltransferase